MVSPLSGCIYRGRIYHDSCYPSEMLSGRHSNQPVTYGPKWGYKPACYKCKIALDVVFSESLFSPHHSLSPRAAVIQNEQLAIIIRFAFGSFPGAYWYEVATFIDNKFSHTELWCDGDFDIYEK